jgi:hypothetical protein
MTTDNRPLLTYRVRVGHLDVCVKARDVPEAILLARRQLGQELPRLYDVIQNLTPTRFQVDDAA